MTEQRPPNPNGGKHRPRSAAERQDEQLQQLIKLAGSVEQLARTTPTETEPPTPDVLRAQFAYTFLGEILGRRREDGFDVPRVEVDRSEGQLTFPELTIGELTATAARLRARNGAEDDLEIPSEGVAVTTDIQDDQPIDAIVVLDTPTNRVPLAIGPCLPPVPGEG
jgi:hypothetical protein